MMESFLEWITILEEVLNQIALTRVVIKGQYHELLGKFIFEYVLGEGRIGCISRDSLESTMMWHVCFFNLLLYEVVEILEKNELLDLSLRIIR